jgi:hypothetical protein
MIIIKMTIQKYFINLKNKRKFYLINLKLNISETKLKKLSHIIVILKDPILIKCKEFLLITKITGI